jgi:hypothetical protein
MLAIALTMIFLLKSLLVVLTLAVGGALTLAGAIVTLSPGLFLWDIVDRHEREIDVTQRSALFPHLKPNLENAGAVALAVGLFLFLLGAQGLVVLMFAVA